MRMISEEQPVFHGGALDRAIAVHGGRREDWLDLSTGINPHAWPARAPSADALRRLPEARSMEMLLAAARRHYRVPQSLGIVAAPGTQALIEALPRLLPGETATVVAPAAGTYREHEHCAAKAGRRVRQVHSLGDVAADEKLAIVVHPNNPDGFFHDPSRMLALAQSLAATGGHLILDEAFCDATPDKSMAGLLPENAIILKSFGKFFGLAGVRLGFAVASPELASCIAQWFGPWAVSGHALETGTAALDDAAWSGSMQTRLEAESQELAVLLARHGFEIAGRNALFVLARHANAISISEALAKAQILVRPFPDRPHQLRFGLPASGLARLDQALGAIMRSL